MLTAINLHFFQKRTGFIFETNHMSSNKYSILFRFQSILVGSYTLWATSYVAPHGESK